MHVSKAVELARARLARPPSRRPRASVEEALAASSSALASRPSPSTPESESRALARIAADPSFDAHVRRNAGLMLKGVRLLNPAQHAVMDRKDERHRPGPAVSFSGAAQAVNDLSPRDNARRIRELEGRLGGARASTVESAPLPGKRLSRFEQEQQDSTDEAYREMREKDAAAQKKIQKANGLETAAKALEALAENESLPPANRQEYAEEAAELRKKAKQLRDEA